MTETAFSKLAGKFANPKVDVLRARLRITARA